MGNNQSIEVTKHTKEDFLDVNDKTQFIEDTLIQQLEKQHEVLGEKIDILHDQNQNFQDSITQLRLQIDRIQERKSKQHKNAELRSANSDLKKRVNKLSRENLKLQSLIQTRTFERPTFPHYNTPTVQSSVGNSRTSLVPLDSILSNIEELRTNIGDMPSLNLRQQRSMMDIDFDKFMGNQSEDEITGSDSECELELDENQQQFLEVANLSERHLFRIRSRDEWCNDQMENLEQEYKREMLRLQEQHSFYAPDLKPEQTDQKPSNSEVSNRKYTISVESTLAGNSSVSRPLNETEMVEKQLSSLLAELEPVYENNLALTPPCNLYRESSDAKWNSSSIRALSSEIKNEMSKLMNEQITSDYYKQLGQSQA